MASVSATGIFPLAILSAMVERSEQPRNIPFEGAGELQSLHQLGRIGFGGKVVGDAITPPSGFGRNERNELAPGAGGHISARVRAKRDIAGVGIEIDNSPKEERFARARWAHQGKTFPRRNLQGYRADQFGCESIDPQRRHKVLPLRGQRWAAQHRPLQRDQRRRAICASVSAARGPSASSGNG